MTDTMIERVARAICHRDGQLDAPLVEGEVRVVVCPFKAARAAIAAMREPTEGMVEAGVDYRLRTTLWGGNTWPDDTRRLFETIIDAALKETPHAD